jgi:hypothetical protein
LVVDHHVAGREHIEKYELKRIVLGAGHFRGALEALFAFRGPELGIALACLIEPPAIHH